MKRLNRPDDVLRVLKCLGAVLRETREQAEMSRAVVVEKLLPMVGVEICEKTLLCYEQMGKDEGEARGGRGVTLPMLLKLGDVYDVPAPILLGKAMERAEQDPRCPTCGGAR